VILTPETLKARESLRCVAKEMTASNPEWSFRSKLEEIAEILDAYDRDMGIKGETQAQDDLRRWHAELVEALKDGDRCDVRFAAPSPKRSEAP
jgi:hypothetical protein